MLPSSNSSLSTHSPSLSPDPQSSLPSGATHKPSTLPFLSPAARSPMQSDPKTNILLVDDHPENLLVLETVLEHLGQNLVRANSGKEALRCLLHNDFAVILLDVQMPEMDGFETAMLIRQRERSRNTPIIFLTAFSTNDAFVFKGYEIGAVDYLLKPIDPTILTSKVKVFVELFQKTEVVKRQADQLTLINGELRQSEERFRSLSACTPVGIFLLDIQGQCTYTNPRCQVICGFTFEESLGEGWIRFLHPDDRERAIADWVHCVRDQHEFLTEYRFGYAEETLRWTSVRSSPMFSDSGELIGHVGTIEDITERKQAEWVREQLIREQTARQQAETINQMKDEFLAMVSHELRTPLNAILGWSKLLLSQQMDETTTQRALETIERNARSQAKLIEDILDVSRIIRGKLRLSIQPVNLNTLLTEILEATCPSAEAKLIQLKINLDSEIPRIAGDPGRLQQVFGNLLSNAIKFTPAEGTVEIHLTRVQANQLDPMESVPQTVGVSQGDRALEEVEAISETSPLRSLGAPSAWEEPEQAVTTTVPPTHANGASHSSPSLPQVAREYAQIKVIDTGIGIPADFLPHVFDHFRQADSTTTRAHGGLGLGLAIARHLVHLHGGTITAESPGKGKGATFTVNLPITNLFITSQVNS